MRQDEPRADAVDGLRETIPHARAWSYVELHAKASTASRASIARGDARANAMTAAAFGAIGGLSNTTFASARVASSARASRCASRAKQSISTSPVGSRGAETRGALVVVAAKKKGSGSYEDDYAYYGDLSSFDSYDEYDDAGAGGYASYAPTKSGGGSSDTGGKKKGAAKRQKKSKSRDENDVPAIAANVRAVINSKQKRKPDAGAIGTSLDIGSSLDSDDGDFVPANSAWSGANKTMFNADLLTSVDESDLTFGDAVPADAPVATVVYTQKEKPKEKPKEKAKAKEETASASKATKKAKTTLVKWGFAESEVDKALSETEVEPEEGEGQAGFNKKRQVDALDWLLLNAAEDTIPVDYKNDALRVRSA